VGGATGTSIPAHASLRKETEEMRGTWETITTIKSILKNYFPVCIVEQSVKLVLNG
jgi:hypothetical protein